MAQQRHQAAVEEVRFQLLFLPNTGFHCDFYQHVSSACLTLTEQAGSLGFKVGLTGVNYHET